MNYAEQKIFCIYVDVHKIYEGFDFDNIFDVLSTLKNKKLNINNFLIEKFKDMLENPNFEQDYWSKTAIGVYKLGPDCIRLTKWLNYYDRYYYDKMNYFDLMGGICLCYCK